MKLLDIQVNLLSGMELEQKLGMITAPFCAPVSTPIKIKQNSKSLNSKSKEGSKVKISESESLPKAVIYRSHSSPLLTPIPWSWDSSPRRPKIVRRNSDNILHKIDENRNFT